MRFEHGPERFRFEVLATVLAQGSLTPPGAPVPAMKTLAEIEPRTPISSAPFTISTPGSYYLTTNLTMAGANPIVIVTNGVTLNLNGFTIASTAPSGMGTAILLYGGLRNLAIQNGFIQDGVTNDSSGNFSGPGFRHGINLCATQGQPNDQIAASLLSATVSRPQ